MATKTWNITVGEKNHEVLVEHSAVSGQRKISLDGVVIAQSKHFSDFGSFHLFQIESHELVVYIQAGFKFSFFLYIDGNEVEGFGALDRPLMERINKRNNTPRSAVVIPILGIVIGNIFFASAQNKAGTDKVILMTLGGLIMGAGIGSYGFKFFKRKDKK